MLLQLSNAHLSPPQFKPPQPSRFSELLNSQISGFLALLIFRKMALSRLASRNLFRRALVSVEDPSMGILRRFSNPPAPESAEKSSEKEITVSESSERTKPALKKRSRRWRKGRDLVPYGFNDLFRPLQQATDNLNRLFGNLTPSLFSGDLDFFGRMKEDNKCYKLQFELPGLSKDEIKITIEDGCIIITGEHKEEKEASSSSFEEEEERSESYRYYNTSLILPDDAKVDEIKAELKNGVLYLTVPKSETRKKEVKVVEIEG